MKRVISILLLSLLAATSLAQVNSSSWDISSIIGYDSAKNEMVVASEDPISHDSAMRVYKMMEGFIAALAEEHVRLSNGQCFVGYRSVMDGQSDMMYLQSACHAYDAYYAVWMKAVERVMRAEQSGPLEAPIKKSQKP